MSRLEESIISINYLFMVRAEEHTPPPPPVPTGDFWKIKHLKGYQLGKKLARERLWRGRYVGVDTSSYVIS